jgi:hypothetical protein
LLEYAQDIFEPKHSRQSASWIFQTRFGSLRRTKGPPKLSVNLSDGVHSSVRQDREKASSTRFLIKHQTQRWGSRSGSEEHPQSRRVDQRLLFLGLDARCAYCPTCELMGDLQACTWREKWLEGAFLLSCCMKIILNNHSTAVHLSTCLS